MKDRYAIFHIAGSPDRDIIATTVVNSYIEENSNIKVIVVTHFPEVWLHNPDVYRVYRHGVTPYFYEDYIMNQDSVVFGQNPIENSDFIYKKKHLAEIWCDKIGVKYNGSLPKLYFTHREYEVAKKLSKTDDKPLFVIQPFETHGLRNIRNHWTTDLPVNIAQKVTNGMKSRGYDVIQIKKPGHPALIGVKSVELNFRLSMAMIKFCDRGLFVDSYGLQVATALEKPSIGVWISGSPKVKGWEMHKNIFANLSTELKAKVDEYNPVFDVEGKLALQNIDTSGAFSAEEILKELE